MRKIKLRAYDKDFDEMVTLDSHIRNGDGDLHGEATYNEEMASFLERFFGCEITEYTGISDKGGDDIYEGDYLIARYYESSREVKAVDGVVVFKDCNFALVKEGTCQNLWLGSNVIIDLLKIGNRFQNDGLLESAR